jgi:8-oxo-dGTP diphosphatase
MGSWNGIGGKIEANETPLQCIIREIFEETGMRPADVTYKGIVTWDVDGAMAGGMYTFTAVVPDGLVYETPRKTDEGILDWKEVSWILNPNNLGVATNLPKFLPKVLDDERLYEHRCVFRSKMLQRVDSVCLT